MAVDPRRIYMLNRAEPREGAVVYWMQRDQRTVGNWALTYAQERAIAAHQPLIVVFCMAPAFLGATFRQYMFMLKGLAVVEQQLLKHNIPFILLHGLPQQVLPQFLSENVAGQLVTDFNPLKLAMDWRTQVAAKISIPFYEVDAHNIIPCRHLSPKLEYAAFTLRKKVENHLSEFLTSLTPLLQHPEYPGSKPVELTDWNEVTKSLSVSHEVPEVHWLEPGENAALISTNDFLVNRLESYAVDRNFPEKSGQSDLSPYLHFGHLSAQHLALEVKRSDAHEGSKKAFLEELIVRRELADNFCLYNPDYDQFKGFNPWARISLNKHRDDPREYCYSPELFEAGSTHDPLWNAAQRQLLKTGKMHGFMRMYWAKKILEWTASPEEALLIAIWLNDKYELDGRDPNGYAGIAWSIGGTHDRPWGERNIFGMIRYMNYQGCKRKFDVAKYIIHNSK